MAFKKILFSFSPEVNPSIAHTEIWIPNKRIVKRNDEKNEEVFTQERKKKKKKTTTTTLLAIQNASLADLWQVFNQFQDVIVSTGTYSQ
jgi:hypothetical protein